MSVERALISLYLPDLKTQNVLLATTGSGTLAATKVADFGTARSDVREKLDSKLATGTGNQKDHASTHEVIGTRPYMPYE